MSHKTACDKGLEWTIVDCCYQDVEDYPRGWGFLDGSAGKDLAPNAGDTGDKDLTPWSGRSPGRGNGNPLQYSCLKKSLGQRSLAGYSPKGRKESDMTELLSTYTHIPVSWKKLSMLYILSLICIQKSRFK